MLDASGRRARASQACRRATSRTIDGRRIDRGPRGRVVRKRSASVRLPGHDGTELDILRLQDPEGYRVSGNDQNPGNDRPDFTTMSPADRLAYHRRRLGLGR